MSFRDRFIGVLACAAVLALSTSALADPEKEDAPASEPLRQVAFELNPLGVAIGRLSANVELVPFAHHGLIVTPYYNRERIGVVGASGGVEVGYRFFTGRTGPVGLYFGPSGFVQWGEDWNMYPVDGNRIEGLTFDAGGQTILWNHVLVGGGAGIGYLHGEPKKGSQVLPRLLCSIGFVL